MNISEPMMMSFIFESGMTVFNTNRLNPRGGEIAAISMLIVITTPNHTGS